MILFQFCRKFITEVVLNMGSTSFEGRHAYLMKESFLSCRFDLFILGYWWCVLKSWIRFWKISWSKKWFQVESLLNFFHPIRIIFDYLCTYAHVSKKVFLFHSFLSNNIILVFWRHTDVITFSFCLIYQQEYLIK